MVARFTATVVRQSNGTIELQPDKPVNTPQLAVGETYEFHLHETDQLAVELPYEVWNVDDVGADLAAEAARKRKK